MEYLICVHFPNWCNLFYFQPKGRIQIDALHQLHGKTWNALGLESNLNENVTMIANILTDKALEEDVNIGQTKPIHASVIMFKVRDQSTRPTRKTTT